MSKNLSESYNRSFIKNILIEVRKRLAKTSLTQAELGKTLGIRQSAVSHLLSGRTQLSIEQFLELCKCLDVKPQDLMKSADGHFAEAVSMSQAVERAIYRSELHLVVYCAATQEITLKDIRFPGAREHQIRDALKELCNVGLLTQNGDKYIQSHIKRIYVAKNRKAGNRVNQNLVMSTWQLNETLEEKDFPYGTKFNSWTTDRFTPSQVKELESALWPIQEKIQRFQAENSASGYSGDEYRYLWNIHLMIGTAMDPRE